MSPMDQAAKLKVLQSLASQTNPMTPSPAGQAPASMPQEPQTVQDQAAQEGPSGGMDVDKLKALLGG